MAKKTSQALKIKKKRWIKILAPKIFNELLIGESYVTDPEVLVGRCINVNLMNITNDIKKQSVNVNFKMDGVSNGNITTSVVSYKMMPASLRKMIRRGKSQIYDSFVCKTSDNILVRIKPLLITRNKTNGMKKTKLRTRAKEAVVRIVSKETYENLVYDIVTNKLQRFIRDSTCKIFPLKTIEIRAFNIEIGKKFKLEVPVPEKHEPKKEEEAEQQQEQEQRREKPSKPVMSDSQQ